MKTGLEEVKKDTAAMKTEIVQMKTDINLMKKDTAEVKVLRDQMNEFKKILTAVYKDEIAAMNA